MRLEYSLKVGLIREAEVLGHVCEAVLALNPLPGKIDALVELPGMWCHAGDGTEGPDYLITAHTCQGCQFVEGSNDRGPSRQII